MTEPDPDQLLKSLEAGMATIRARHSRKSVDRSTFRVMSIAIIVIGLIALVVVLQYAASELTGRRPPGKATPEAPANAGAK